MKWLVRCQTHSKCLIDTTGLPSASTGIKAYVLLPLLTSTPRKELRVEGGNEALCAPGNQQDRSADS